MTKKLTFLTFLMCIFSLSAYAQTVLQGQVDVHKWSENAWRGYERNESIEQDHEKHFIQITSKHNGLRIQEFY